MLEGEEDPVSLRVCLFMKFHVTSSDEKSVLLVPDPGHGAIAGLNPNLFVCKLARCVVLCCVVLCFVVLCCGVLCCDVIPCMTATIYCTQNYL